MPCASFSMPDGPGQSSIENDAHDIEKLLLKTQVSEKFLLSEVNLIIKYIIVQDQDGQNNNTKVMPVSTAREIEGGGEVEVGRRRLHLVNDYARRQSGLKETWYTISIWRQT